MARRRKHHRSRKTGLPPGTLVYVGDQPASAPVITRYTYDESGCQVQTLSGPGQLTAPAPAPYRTWINVEGLHDLGAMQAIGEHFGIHHLVLEDIVNTDQRPKAELQGDHLFLTLKMIQGWPGDSPDLAVEQVSFVLGPHYLISFQERPGDVFSPVRERLNGTGVRLRAQGVDYLMYRLLDQVVDRYLVMLEAMDTELDQLEEALPDNRGKDGITRLQHRKRQLQAMRRAVVPLREAVLALQREETPLLSDFTRRYLTDVYDHLIQVQEILEHLRELCVELRETHLALLSNRSNEVMKLLTMIATVFIPLTFIVGVYGMNFHHMPELAWRYGYLIVWVVMVLVSLVMVRYFYRKGWF